MTKQKRIGATVQAVEGREKKIGDIIQELKQFRRGKKLNGLCLREMIEDGRSWHLTGE